MPTTIRLSRSLLPVMAILLFLGGCSRHPTARYLYGSNCGICHHGGQGMAGSVPPLIGRIDRIAATPEGRAYLAAVLMNGLSGPIKANGSPYNAEMPLFRYLKDDQAATILTWLSEQGGTKPAPKIMPEDVAYARAHRIGASGVANLRDKLSHTQGMP
ncbi:cytochrome c-552 class I [Acetobacter estunensis NRIC 0472]|uniref:C-type cytochrome n=1 Tax=Acetobacter estunensis TaxID=104097 RepID=A0A967B5A1_9PROT|nr:c-type cytochrome [Acetobacter estunensis]GBQ28915.1 cytochrome c-552 class I [Acetobacter estunensis NRIC 0472]